MRERVRRLARKLCLSFASLAVVLGGAELVCRAVGYAPQADTFRWMAHPDLQAVPMPSQDTWLGRDDPATGQVRLPIRINRYSQRGPDYPLQKERGELRIVVVGDSLTMGQGMRDEECYPAVLGELLAAQQPERGRVRVVNAGVNGWATWHYMRWAQTQLERFRPDVLVVGLYLGNDMVVPRNAPLAIPVPLENALRGSALYRFLVETYRAYLWKRVEAARRDLSVEELAAELERYKGLAESELSDEDQRVLWERHALPHLAALRDACRKLEVDVAVLLIPSYPMVITDGPPPVYLFLRQRLGELGLATIECLEPVRAAGAVAWLSYDVGHLSVLGNALVAQALRDGLVRLGLLR